MESDADGTFYDLRFTPDVQQIWSPQPGGVYTTFTDVNELKQVIGEHRDSELARARFHGSVNFVGQLSRERYGAYAHF